LAFRHGAGKAPPEKELPGSGGVGRLVNYSFAKNIQDLRREKPPEKEPSRA
jgi:hypothetical protein